MVKKIFLPIISFSLLILGAAFLNADRHISYAEDDDEEEEEEREERDDENEERSEEKDETVKIAPAPSVTTTTTPQTTITVQKDGDGDGLYDSEDPHPTIPEFFIVKDDNRNGIVDSFEASP